MEFVLIIIVVVIVSVISAALKKKPKSSGEQEAPPARPTMTDIQRAFMMAAGMPENEQNRPPVRTPAPYSPSASGSYVPPVSHYEPTVAPTEFIPYAAQPYSGTSENTVVRPMEPVNPYANAQIRSYFMDEDEKEPLAQAASVREQNSMGTGIPLFEDQRDIVKALIYAEILPRRNGAQRVR